MSFATTLLLLGLLGVGISEAQTSARRAQSDHLLTLEGIARDPAEWIGSSPAEVAWSEDGQSIYFMWNPEAKEEAELFVISRDGGRPIRVEQRWLVPTREGETDKDSTLKVYEAHGDIFLFTIASGAVRRLTQTEAEERNPRFTFDQKAITFEQDQNLFRIAVESGNLSQITNFKTGKDPEAKPKHTQLQEYLEVQQQELFEYLRKEDRLEKERKEREKVERGNSLDPVYLEQGQRVSDLALSPDGRFVTFILSDRSKAEDGRVVDMPKYVTKSGFVETENLRSGFGIGRVKAGEPVVSYRLGALSLANNQIAWVDHGQGDRAINFNAPTWSEDGTKAVAWAGSVDHKDAWLLLLDLAAGTARPIVHEHDDAWVRGFRAGRGGRDGLTYGFLPDNEGVYFFSERDGFYHLYVTDVQGGEPKQLTRGNFELADLRLSKDKDTWYFTSTEVHPGEHRLYSMPLAGGPPTGLTSRPGWYTYELSPDEQMVALTYSSPTEPAELFVMPNRPGAEEKRLTVSTTEEFGSYPWRSSDIVTFDDGEGHTIHADVWQPEQPHPSRPAIIRVHGGGWSQGVYRRWSNGVPFYHYLVQEGFTVLNIDYRGSRGYGRDFRTGIYRHMGETEIKSVLAAVEVLVEQYDVDRRRIGIFGGSYGGFLTLMALFKHPGVFAAGAVRAPVTDWAHYSHGYTTRILNNPYDDTEAYERSSPIFFAEGFQDHLLIQHGVEDNNVHFQDSVRLAQRLLELKKDNWEIMLYPIEAHSLRGEEYNRLDVMRRRVKLFNRVLKGPRPGES